MKKTAKITFCAMMSALATVFMLMAYFPYMTYAIPAVSGLFIMAALIEVNAGFALMSYMSSAVLVFLSCDLESKFLYIFFFGYYPIVKALIEKIKKPVIEWIIKFAVFNIAVLTVYLVFSKFFGFSMEDFNDISKYGAYILLAAGNVVFVFYDIAVSRMSMFYIFKLHPKIKKLLQ